jgi:hypothetical protein
LNDPDGLAGGAADAAGAAIDSTGGTGGSAGSSGGSAESAGAAGGGVPSGSARLSRIFGNGRVSVTGRRLSEEDVKAASWPLLESADPAMPSGAGVSRCSDCVAVASGGADFISG